MNCPPLGFGKSEIFWPSATAAMDVGMGTTTGLENAVVVVAQGSLLVSRTVIVSPPVRLVVVYTGPMPPMMTCPFRYHWYCGDGPAPVDVAVKVTGTPGVKTFAGFALTETAGVTAGDTVTTNGFDVCCTGLAHCAFDVRRAVITSPFVHPVAE